VKRSVQSSLRQLGGAFTNEQIALVLMAAWLRHVAGTKWGAKRYRNVGNLPELTLAKSGTQPAYAALQR
jgi:hypothetical protein